MNRKLILLLLTAVILVVLCIGCGKSTSSSTDPNATKVIVVAFDGLDPRLVDMWMGEGLLPNFSKLEKMGTFEPLGTSIPPQSPVAWSNFITGQNPGGHGIFDFIHRNPDTYLPYLSTSKTESPKKFWKLAGYKVPVDKAGVHLLRKGRAFWQYLGDAGIDTTVFSIPSNFPPVEGPFRSLSGMGTPDLMGGYGTFSYFTNDPPKSDKEITGGKVYPVQVMDNTVNAEITGPRNSFLDLPEGEMPPYTKVPFTVHIDHDARAASIDISGERIVLGKGDWSDWVQLSFEMAPVFATVKGMVRFKLIDIDPFKLYVSPINIDPREPAMPISTPPEYSLELSIAQGGPFHTQGIPEDTKALSANVLSNEAFLEQANTVLAERLNLYHYELARFEQKGKGFLFFYFSSSDQLSHMFWRTMDDKHPAYNAEKDANYRNVIRDTYMKLDKALGDAMALINDNTTLFVMSDHGFAPYNQSFHLSTWLLDNGYVMLQDPSERESEFLQNVEWMGTKAYSLGINGVYLNLMGREASGIVSPSDADALLREIKQKLLAVTDPETGDKVISEVYLTKEVYKGPYVKDAPDLIIGYARGYRGSWETALGKFPKGSLLTPNDDEWSGDHCMAAEEVPGSLFCSRETKIGDPKLYDLPVTILELFGLPRPKDMIGRNIFTGK